MLIYYVYDLFSQLNTGAVVVMIVWLDLQLPMQSVPITTNVDQWLATGQWFSPGTPVFSTNKTDCHDIAEILLKVVLNTINQTIWIKYCLF